MFFPYFYRFLILTFLLSHTCVSANAQRKPNRPYISTGIDGYLLSTTVQQKDGEFIKFSTPRFTGFLHLGVLLHYDFNKRVGLFTGLNVKNIGFIEKMDNPDSTIKRRAYTFGIPLGIKWGDVQYGSYVMLGGGIDFPFNYKEKGFIERNKKAKFNEWFSNRTPAAMPYVFIGAHLRPVLSIKLQYYPGNFLNPDYTGNRNGSAIKPYEGYNVQLAILTVGININYWP